MKGYATSIFMNRIKAAILSLLLTACASSPTLHTESPAGSLEKKEVVPFFGAFQVHRYTWVNGLRLLIIEDHSSPTFAYQTWFQVGSKDETPLKTGLAHLFEHMMFKGTKTLKDGDFDRLLEASGVEGENAFTSRDYTTYIQELPKDKIETIIRLESDRMVNLVIDEKSFKTEREVVQNERRFRNENSPDGTLEQELFHLAFQKHPYHWPIIGYQEDLDRMNERDAEEFYRSFYSPDHATIVIVGDVQPQAVQSMIQKYYGHIPKRMTKNTSLPTEPVQARFRRQRLKLNIQVEKLLMGYHIPSIMHSDMPALAVLQNILTGGKSARLPRALIDTGLASGVESYEMEGKDPSLYLLMANLQNKKHAAQAESIILKELTSLRKDLVSFQELEKAKNKIEFNFYENLSSNFEKAYFLGHYETIAGDFQNGIRRHQQTQLVKPEDLRSVVKKYFRPENRTVITGIPK